MNNYGRKTILLYRDRRINKLVTLTLKFWKIKIIIIIFFQMNLKKKFEKLVGSNSFIFLLKKFIIKIYFMWSTIKDKLL